MLSTKSLKIDLETVFPDSKVGTGHNRNSSFNSEITQFQ